MEIIEGSFYVATTTGTVSSKSFYYESAYKATPVTLVSTTSYASYTPFSGSYYIPCTCSFNLEGKASTTEKTRNLQFFFVIKYAYRRSSDQKAVIQAYAYFNGVNSNFNLTADLTDIVGNVALFYKK